MDIKKILVGLAIVSAVIYRVSTLKIGPCSPELEETINK